MHNACELEVNTEPAFGQRLQQLFLQALEIDDTQRETFVRRWCEGEPQLAEALRLLLRRDEERSALDAPLALEINPILREAAPWLGLDPTSVGPYRLVRLLGEGGMGRVYLAERTVAGLSITVAIKLIRADRTIPGLLPRFEAERRHLASLDHPGICRFIDAGVLEDGTPYVAMEAVDGEPLLAYCDRNRLSVEARLSLLRKVLAAVAHAHERLLVHRDIKPHNILVSPSGDPKLLDFGIAKSMCDEGAPDTRTADRFFTPSVSAPEQLLGEPVGVGCDVYALGALAYELLAGAGPFDLTGLRAAEIERLILQVDPPLPSRRAEQQQAAAEQRGFTDSSGLARHLRGDLDAIVQTCLRKTPVDRYPNVRALDAEFERYLSGRPVEARAAGWPYRASLFVRRNRLPVALSVALAIALLAAGIGLTWQTGVLAEQRNNALVERDLAIHVVRVLQRAFLGADPARSAGDEVSARKILDAARPEIDSLLEHQPELFALLADTLSTVELGLSASTQAAELAERGIDAALDGGASAQVLRSLRLTAARAHTGIGNYDRAHRLLTDVRATEAQPAADWLIAMARLTLRTSDSELATVLLRQALELLAARTGTDELATEARWELAESMRWAGDLEQSIAIYADTLTWQLRELDPDHPRVVQTRVRWLTVRAEHGQATDVMNDFSNAVRAVRAHYGESSSMLGMARTAFGGVLYQAGDKLGAARELREAWRIWRQSIGSEHSNTLQVGFNLAYVLSETDDGRLEAEQLMREVLSASESRFGPERPFTIYVRTQLASLLGQLQRWQDALKLMASREAAQGHTVVSRSNRETQLRVVASVLGGAGCLRETAEPATGDCRAATALEARLQASLSTDEPAP